MKNSLNEQDSRTSLSITSCADVGNKTLLRGNPHKIEELIKTHVQYICLVVITRYSHYYIILEPICYLHCQDD